MRTQEEEIRCLAEQHGFQEITWKTELVSALCDSEFWFLFALPVILVIGLFVCIEYLSFHLGGWTAVAIATPVLVVIYGIAFWAVSDEL